MVFWHPPPIGIGYQHTPRGARSPRSGTAASIRQVNESDVAFQRKGIIPRWNETKGNQVPVRRDAGSKRYMPVKSPALSGILPWNSSAGLRKVYLPRQYPAATCQTLNYSSPIILLDSRIHCAQGDIVRCEAPLTVLSLTLPDLPRRDRFLSLRRSDARVSLNGCVPCVMVC